MNIGLGVTSDCHLLREKIYVLKRSEIGRRWGRTDERSRGNVRLGRRFVFKGTRGRKVQYNGHIRKRISMAWAGRRKPS